jgi:hypothetical protein
VNTVTARLRSWQRWVLGIGPIGLAALFFVRATVPVIDSLLLGIFVVLVAGTLALIAGSRAGAGVVLALSLALFQPMTAREFSFSLTAVDSDLWRVWAIASAISIGWSIVASIVVLVAGDRTEVASPWRVTSVVAGGLALGVAATALFPVLAPQPAYGQGLDADAIEALPVIRMFDFGYDPIAVDAVAGEPYRARITNPTALPHTFTIEALDLEVFVPAGRWAIVELDADDLSGAPLAVVCTIGDHLSLGMAGVVEVR